MERVDAFKSFGRLMGREEKKKAVCFEEMLKEVMKVAKDEREATKLLTKRVAINLISFTLKRQESKQPASSSLKLFNLVVPKRKRGSCGKRDDNTYRCSFNDSDYNSGEEKEDHQEGRKFRRIEEEKSRKPKKKLMKKEDEASLIWKGCLFLICFGAIEELDGGDMKLILEKTLTQTDLESGQGKLSIPINQVRRKFLEPQEERLLEQIGDDGCRRKGIVDVAFMEPSNKLCTNMALKRWPMKSGGLFALNQGWNGVVQRNKGLLKLGAKVHVWSFRTNKSKQLGFALLVVD